VSTSLFPFAQNQIVMIYATKNQLAPQIIAVLLVFLIGPAEEIFWRGFVQQRLSTIYDQQKGYIFATCLYAMVHIYAMNFMLFMAALICGAFWGYWYKKTGSLWVVMISHALWDVTIFILFPIK
ncbi:MAG: CPBP family intramembrane glutamic endopeptidase, partial [Candidatus Omnitrophota bacterium]